MAKASASATAVEVDVAIVGGGISGLYAGWRLLTCAPPGGNVPKRVVVFESSGRTGGRLLTWYPFADHGVFDLHAELGGMRFFEQQSLVWGLIGYFVQCRALQPPIDFYVADPNGNNLWYLRETSLKAPDFYNPDRLPYRQDADSRYADPASIINNLITSVLAESRDRIAAKLGNRTQPATWQDWDAIKPILRYRGRLLWNVGFWNLLYDVLSPESYAYVTDAFGYSSLTNNWNAAEAMQSVFLDFTTNPKYKTLREGFGYLPHLVRSEFVKAKGDLRLRHTVVDLTKNGKAFELGVRHPGPDGTPTYTTWRAGKVILAMPRRSLELLNRNAYWDADRPVDGRTLRWFIESVIPYPAFKTFFAYDEPWWRKPPISIAAGRSVSDLPIRQTYYFPPHPKPFSPDEVPAEARALLMASYNDYASVPFWRALEAPEDYKQAADVVLSELPSATPAGFRSKGSNAAFTAYVADAHARLPEEPGFHLAPPEMVRYAQQQLRLLHLNQPQPDPIPLPNQSEKTFGYFLAAYKDWGHDPYGGGWNFWAPGIHVDTVMQRIRQPFERDELYIVGEAYSGAQGWVEGALTTTERVLQAKFRLPPPRWEPADAYLGY
jgi:Flavin containing amine oxidoreductase